MGTATSIVLLDAASTPVSHTFAYNPMPQNVAGFEDRSIGVAVGYNRITMQLRRPQPNRSRATVANRFYNATIKIESPILETVSNSTVSGIAPAPTVAYTTIAEMRFALPERSARVDRATIVKWAANLLLNSQVVTLIADLEMPY